MRLFKTGAKSQTPAVRARFVERESLSKVGSLAEAQARVSFAVRLPQGLGTPSLIAASSESQAASGQAAAMFRYDDLAGGLTVLEQSGSEVVAIRGGIQAVLVADGAGGMVRWIENGVAFTVIAQTGGRDELLAAVERI